jgi:hypothetical protein
LRAAEPDAATPQGDHQAASRAEPIKERRPQLSSCLTRRGRVARSRGGRSSSCLLAIARAMRRLATLTHAISKSRTTTPHQRQQRTPVEDAEVTCAGVTSSAGTSAQTEL